MGLTFGYELRLPASCSEDDVNVVLQNLKRRAEQLRFEKVSATYEGVIDFLPDEWRHVFNVFADVNARPVNKDARPYSGDVNTARGFLAMPGKGAEAASFGFMRRTFDNTGSRDWFWQGWCKTQYASVFSAIARHQARRVSDRLNAVYAAEASDVDPRVQRAQRKVLKRSDW